MTAGQNARFSAGATVSGVVPGSPAEKAGITKGDIITALGNRTIQDPSELRAAVHEEPAGASLNATLIRGGDQQQVTITLGSSPTRP
jgi:putative serine protease PepD